MKRTELGRSPRTLVSPVILEYPSYAPVLQFAILHSAGVNFLFIVSTTVVITQPQVSN